jgi:hypothetical protein
MQEAEAFTQAVLEEGKYEFRLSTSGWIQVN